MLFYYFLEPFARMCKGLKMVSFPRFSHSYDHFSLFSFVGYHYIIRKQKNQIVLTTQEKC
ncbi:hypothetical protein BREVNS_0926 [Brevinematales bacterium NS]|nr:hypothetical protein BREVNS_0926 [Brevinematales bacterium NS]